MNSLLGALAWLTDPVNWSGSRGIPVRLLEHLGITGIAVLVAALIAVSLGLYIGHTGRLSFLVVSTTGALRALPTLGLLVLFALWLGIGLGPVIIVLVVLAIPPLLAGAYAGVESVDRSTIDAARAMGMTEWQILTRVEIPLGLPIIVGGLRSAVLQVVATATIAAYLPIGGLGRYIFDYLTLRRFEPVFAGAILVTLLALVLEGVFALLQRLAVPRGVRILQGSSAARGGIGRAERIQLAAGSLDGDAPPGPPGDRPDPVPAAPTSSHPTQ
ncbi:ABC transporter permease [Labedella phragmitis]|uniref:ABC transporter permease n=1 Tax=Labedella phragmitis TaxID=2498849 RepID=A0A3S4BM70_9MICO|nr:ABC transporter permease [Labedella phragmitis]RWZ53120.1 ABC transporter permease [Labedella phragmitis]